MAVGTRQQSCTYTTRERPHPMHTKTLTVKFDESTTITGFKTPVGTILVFEGGFDSVKKALEAQGLNPAAVLSDYNNANLLDAAGIEMDGNLDQLKGQIVAIQQTAEGLSLADARTKIEKLGYEQLVEFAVNEDWTGTHFIATMKPQNIEIDDEVPNLSSYDKKSDTDFGMTPWSAYVEQQNLEFYLDTENNVVRGSTTGQTVVYFLGSMGARTVIAQLGLNPESKKVLSSSFDTDVQLIQVPDTDVYIEAIDGGYDVASVSYEQLVNYLTSNSDDIMWATATTEYPIEEISSQIDNNPVNVYTYKKLDEQSLDAPRYKTLMRSVDDENALRGGGVNDESGRPSAARAATSRAASSASSAIGFSTSTCFPASVACTVKGKCRSCGRHSRTASTDSSPRAAAKSVVWRRAPYSLAACSARSATLSTQ